MKIMQSIAYRNIDLIPMIAKGQTIGKLVELLKSKDTDQFTNANETIANLFVSTDPSIIDKAICEGYLPAVFSVLCSS